MSEPTETIPVVLAYAPAPAESQREGRRWMLWYWLLELPALVVPFVIFTWTVSPIMVMLALAREIFNLPSLMTADMSIAFLAFSYFLAFPIAYLGLRLFVWGSASLAELWGAIALAALSAGGITWVCLLIFSESIRTVEIIILLSAGAILIAGVAVICIKRNRWPLKTHAMFSLLTAYLANASICLAAFVEDPSLGYYITIYVCLVYLAHAVLLVARRLSW